MIDHEIIKYITIEDGTCYRGHCSTLTKMYSGVYYVGFRHLKGTRYKYFYCNNIYMGLYWYLFDEVDWYHRYRREHKEKIKNMFRLMKICRQYL